MTHALNKLQNIGSATRTNSQIDSGPGATMNKVAQLVIFHFVICAFTISESLVTTLYVSNIGQHCENHAGEVHNRESLFSLYCEALIVRKLLGRISVLPAIFIPSVIYLKQCGMNKKNYKQEKKNSELNI